MKGAYYNENDPHAAQWLRNLIAQGFIPKGYVDERSIADVQPSDLDGYTQCHFFAGIGGWAYAARLAGWPDERPLWTGSCPCQPFSVAGRGAGADDARHLWLHFFRLIRSCRPVVVMGEQVAGKAGYGWLDGVCADLAGEGYASRGVDIPSCAVDAPHIRSRLYWVAVADADGRGRDRGTEASVRLQEQRAVAERADAPRGMGDAQSIQQRARLRDNRRHSRSVQSGRLENGESGSDVGDGVSCIRNGTFWSDADACGLADTDLAIVQHQPPAGQLSFNEQDAGIGIRAGSRNGTFWSDAEPLVCHDGKTRRTKPGLSLLVDGVSGGVAVGRAGETGIAAFQAEKLVSRVGAWKGFGNAIVPQLAAEVIRAFMDEN